MLPWRDCALSVEGLDLIRPCGRVEELVGLGKEHGIPVVDDLGAGALVECPPEPRIGDSMRLGVDLLTCSGDKLIGGPQSGIILGKREWIDRIRTNPLFRTLRVDKMTLVAMEATLRLFLRPGGPGDAHPTWQMLGRTGEELARAAGELAERIRHDAEPFGAELQDGFSQVGSGSLPGESLPTTLVALTHPKQGASALARTLRHADPPIYTRIVEDRVCLDPRTIREGEVDPVIEVLRKLA